MDSYTVSVHILSSVVGRGSLEIHVADHRISLPRHDPKVFNLVLVDYIQTSIQIRFCGGPE